MNHRKLFNDKDELDSSLINYLNLFKENDLIKKNVNLENLDFVQENITVDKIDYYYSNVIARASKTMFNCRNEMNNSNKESSNN